MSQPVSENEANSSAPAEFATPQRPVAVIGGGVIGAACAYYLAEAGCPVLLIDRAEFGQGCSHANCGYVSPSHVLPLCKPGAILSTLKTMFQRNSAFKMRPRLDPAMWSWFWKFARHCNREDMIRSGWALHHLLASSRQLYDDLMTSRVLEDCDWETRGILFVHHTPQTFEKFSETDAFLRNEYGVGAQRFAEPELQKLEPALKPGVAGGWLYDIDAHVRPDKLMSAWQRRLLRQGVAIRENCEFLGFELSGHSVSAIQTNAGRIEVDQVVVATGAWTRLLARQLKMSVPIEPGKGYSITMRRPNLCPTYPMIFQDHRVAITPMQSGYRIGSTMEFAGFDRTLRRERLNLLIEGAKLYLHDPLTEPFLETWWGWRPMSCDGVPFIGAMPKFDNVYLAAGHSMVGISLATGTGKLIAEMVTGATPHVDPLPYRVDRLQHRRRSAAPQPVG